MKKTVFICDRCGKEYDFNHKEMRNRELKLRDYEGDEFDLCHQCYSELEKWYSTHSLGEGEQMIIEEIDGRKKIVQCTDEQLYSYWLDMYSDLYAYDDFKRRCIANGTKVIEE